MSTDSLTFFLRHPVFTLAEFERWRGPGRSTHRSTKELLLHHCRAGRIIRIRRGLYASVPPAVDAEGFVVDPWLVASRLAEDAVLAFHTALEFHGRAYTPHTRHFFSSARAARTVRFQGQTYVRISPPGFAGKKKDTGIVSSERAGLPIRVTSLERTLVDVLDRPELGGGWEEIWRSLGSVEYFNLDQVIEYTELLRNATTAAKVGFFLEQHRERLMVTDQHLKRLHDLRPKQRHYLVRSKRDPGQLVKPWNLIVPASVLERHWEEPA